MVQHSMLPTQHPVSLYSVSSSLYLQGVTFSEHEMLSECISLIQSSKKYFCFLFQVVPSSDFTARLKSVDAGINS